MAKKRKKTRKELLKEPDEFFNDLNQTDQPGH